ncbi:MAG: PQQ-binding-like beta-propeller repeat protein [Candidatus Eremiobacterota bacterium]
MFRDKDETGDKFDFLPGSSEFSMLEGERIFYNYVKELYETHGKRIEKYRDQLLEMGKNLSIPTDSQREIELYIREEYFSYLEDVVSEEIKTEKKPGKKMLQEKTKKESVDELLDLSLLEEKNKLLSIKKELQEKEKEFQSLTKELEKERKELENYKDKTYKELGKERINIRKEKMELAHDREEFQNFLESQKDEEENRETFIKLQKTIEELREEKNRLEKEKNEVSVTGRETRAMAKPDEKMLEMLQRIKKLEEDNEKLQKENREYTEKIASSGQNRTGHGEDTKKLQKAIEKLRDEKKSLLEKKEELEKLLEIQKKTDNICEDSIKKAMEEFNEKKARGEKELKEKEELMKEKYDSVTWEVQKKLLELEREKEHFEELKGKHIKQFHDEEKKLKEKYDKLMYELNRERGNIEKVRQEFTGLQERMKKELEEQKGFLEKKGVALELEKESLESEKWEIEKFLKEEKKTLEWRLHLLTQERKIFEKEKKELMDNLAEQEKEFEIKFLELSDEKARLEMEKEEFQRNVEQERISIKRALWEAEEKQAAIEIQKEAIESIKESPEKKKELEHLELELKKAKRELKIEEEELLNKKREYETAMKFVGKLREKLVDIKDDFIQTTAHDPVERDWQILETIIESATGEQRKEFPSEPDTKKIVNKIIHRKTLPLKYDIYPSPPLDLDIKAISYWPLFQGNVKRDGHSASEYELMPPLEETWEFKTKGSVLNSPSIYSEAVYVSSEEKLYAVKFHTGKELWSLDMAVNSTPCVNDHALFTGSLDNKFYSLDRMTGKQLWKYKTHGEIKSSPLIEEGLVYFGSEDGTLYALDEIKGHKVWDFSTNGQIKAPPALYRGIIYINSTDNYIYGLNASTGDEIWKYNLNTEGDMPVIYKEQLIITDNMSRLHFFNSRTGEKIRDIQLTGNLSGMAVLDNIIYITSTEGVIFALNGLSCEETWKQNFNISFTGAPVIANGVIYAGTMEGELYSIVMKEKKKFLKKRPGFKHFSTNVGGKIMAPPAIASGLIITGSRNLYCLKTAGR